MAATATWVLLARSVFRSGVDPSSLGIFFKKDASSAVDSCLEEALGYATTDGGIGTD